MHYLPLSPAFFAILVALFLLLVALIQVGILRYAYMRLGVSSGAALSLLLASLIGSYVNIPLFQLPEQHILSGREVWSFGVPYSVPEHGHADRGRFAQPRRHSGAWSSRCFDRRSRDLRRHPTAHHPRGGG